MSRADTKREKAVRITIRRLEGVADLVMAQAQAASNMEQGNEILIRWASYCGAIGILKAVKNGTAEQIAGGVKLAEKHIRRIQNELCDDGNSPYVRVLDTHFQAFD